MECNNIYKFIFGLVFCLVSMMGCEQPVSSQKKIGILLFGDSRQQQVTGFIDEMTALGFKQSNSVQYETRNAKNNRKQLTELARNLISTKPDLLVAAGGLEADIFKKLTRDTNIPVLILYVNAIVERGLVESRKITGWNATGIDNLNAELSGKRVELIKNVLPETNRILILYYDRITPSRIGQENAKLIATKLGIEIIAKKVNSRSDIKAAMENLKPGDIDVMLTVPTAPIDNALKEIILPHVDRLKIPLFTHSRPLAELGAFASYGSNFYDNGTQSARLAKKILSGESAENIPFEVPKILIYTINSDVQKRLGIKLTAIAKNQVDSFVTTKN